MNRPTEPLREGQRDPVVAADDSVAGEVAETGRALREHGCLLVLELVRGRDGEPGGDGGPRARRGHEPLERLDDRAGAWIPQRCVGGDELVPRHRRPAAGLTVPVERALLVEGEAQPCRCLAQNVVAGEDELRAELDGRAVVETGRVDASTHPVARLEHVDLEAPSRQRLGRREPGEAGPDDDDPTGGQAQRGSAR